MPNDEDGAESIPSEHESASAEGADAPSRRRLWLGLVTAAVLVPAWLLVSAVYRVYRPVTDEVPAQADAVVVFAGEQARSELGSDLVHDGAAAVLVSSFGSNDPVLSSLCGQSQPFEVICFEPERPTTKSEAAAFGELARQRGWSSVVAVTGDYHSERAGLWAERCIDADVSFALVDWGRPGRQVVLHEVGGILVARLLDRSC